MGRWLDPLREELDAAGEPVTFFFRDDDAGWDDEALLALLDVFAAYAVPLDLAAIPVALTAELAAELRRRAIVVHQHGYSHTNHEPFGRPCEFGPSRPLGEQRRDIERGDDRLRALLGDFVAPIFTPPWNRCTPSTARILRELGFAALSRDVSAEPVAVSGLHELRVGVDWVRPQRAEKLATAVRTGAPVGVMLHHALMGEADRDALVALLETLATDPNARCVRMSSLVGALALEAR